MRIKYENLPVWIGVMGFLSALTVCLISTLDAGSAPMDQNPFTISTFECSSIYYQTEQAGDCQVFFKPKGGKEWRRGMDLVYDAQERESIEEVWSD